MRETITMTTVEQRRAWVLTKVMAGEVEVGEAAQLLGLSVRSVWRLKRRRSTKQARPSLVTWRSRPTDWRAKSIYARPKSSEVESNCAGDFA